MNPKSLLNEFKGKDFQESGEEKEKAAKRMRWVLAFILTAYSVIIFNLITLSPLTQSFVYKFLFELKKVY